MFPSPREDCGGSNGGDEDTNEIDIVCFRPLARIRGDLTQDLSGQQVLAFKFPYSLED